MAILNRAADDYTQDGRQFRLTTVQGKDALLFVKMRGTEEINTCYEWVVQAYAKSTDLQIDALLGTPASVGMFGSDSTAIRSFSGTVTRCSFLGIRNETPVYEIRLRPKLWQLGLVHRTRVFQALSIPDILKQVLTGLTITNNIQGSYDPVNYCVQYRETDLDFFNRLMEQEGISYYFTHADGGETLVLTDVAQGFAQASDAIKYIPPSNDTHEEGHIRVWAYGGETVSDKVTLWDSNFQLPGKNLEAVKNGAGVSSPLYEIYDFPGGYSKLYDGINSGGGEAASNLQNIFTRNGLYAGVAIERARVDGQSMAGAGTTDVLTSGMKFTLAGHPIGDFNIGYLVVRCHHRLGNTAYFAATEDDLEPGYDVTIHAHPSLTAYRPPCRTPRPIIAGPQTAIVVGPSGQEIFTDKYGRVKVQFPWDRDGTDDASSSCWLRVAQPWAGNQWGFIALPRIGHEVVVSFLEGDPDRPIITGSVYNADNMPPYALPDNMTQTGLKTRSTLQGGTDNFNELRFEDKKGSEHIFFHAEKDFMREVENNDSLTVGNDRTKTVHNNETIVVEEGDRTTTIKKGKESLTVSKGDMITDVAEGNETHTVDKGTRTTSIHGDDSLEVTDGGLSVKVDKGAVSIDATQGDISVKADSGKISVEAGTSIELKVGGNSIKIDATSITLKDTNGNQIQMGPAGIDIKGSMISLNGSAKVDVTGGMVSIN